MNKIPELPLLLTVALALGLLLALVWLVGGGTLPVSQAQPDGSIVRVATTGQDTPGCGGEANPCRTVQYAVDVAEPGGEVRVAAGLYGGVHNRGGLAQVVYLSKTLTLRGGYTTTNWVSPDPAANPTTLHAGGHGRVLYATGAITVELAGLRITGGNATGLGGSALTDDVGGGVYVYAASATIRDCEIYNNVASTTRWGGGGGLYLWGSRATVEGNTILGNTASSGLGGFGGGVYLDKCAATLRDNRVQGNVASTGEEGFGGGVYFLVSQVDLQDNLVRANVASANWSGDGGGLYLFGASGRLEGNTIVSNTASTGWAGRGGGMHLCTSELTLAGNTIAGNVASTASTGSGGGLWFCTTAASLAGNTIVDNVGSTLAEGYGGGLCLTLSHVSLDGNLIISNTAAVSEGVTAQGGGLWVHEGSVFTSTNDVVARNMAGSQGDGLWLDSYETEAPTAGRLLHSTVADNGQVGQGLYVGPLATLASTNTVIAGHGAVGVTVAAGGTARLEATLWYGNGADTGGEGSIVTGTINVYGDPFFVDPGAWDYHLGPSSAALDRGLDAGVRHDVDHQPRPYGLPDLGADEYWPPGALKRIYLPCVMRSR